jgi:hypothetical protein
VIQHSRDDQALIVRSAGLPDPSMVDAVSQAQRALLMTAASSRLADRYRPGPEKDGGAEDMLRSTTAAATPAAADVYALGRDPGEREGM